MARLGNHQGDVRNEFRKGVRTMKALRFHEFGNPSVLRIEEQALPALQAGEALVQISASSINPSDVRQVAGRFHSQLPMTPGRDYAGVVVEGGAWKGKQVWGTGVGFGIVRPGAHAEFPVPFSWLSEKPEGLSMEQSAVIGVPYLAAWQSLVDAGGLQKGERLLITGASCGFGATQIAHWKGATVLGADIVQGS
jgi:NADPH:quinone reductase